MVGFCLDTCHAHAGGNDLATVVEDVVKITGSHRPGALQRQPRRLRLRRRPARQPRARATSTPRLLAAIVRDAGAPVVLRDARRRGRAPAPTSPSCASGCDGAGPAPRADPAVGAGPPRAVLAGCRSAAAPRGRRRTRADRARDTAGTGDALRSRPQQFGDLYLPVGARRGTVRGTVVVIHGGFWQSGYGLDLRRPDQPPTSRGAGGSCWNIEYRRARRRRRLAEHVRRRRAPASTTSRDLDLPDLRRAVADVVLLGHSAGGHLAAWAACARTGHPGGAPRVAATAIVPQAGVLDLRAAARARASAGRPCADLMGGMPDGGAAALRLGRPGRAAAARASRSGACTARDDTTVPISQSRAYVEAAAGRRRRRRARRGPPATTSR